MGCFLPRALHRRRNLWRRDLWRVRRPLHCQKIAPNTAPIVETQAGDVQGFVENNVFAFKGIPYAAPPVGDLRWREPQPAALWQGVLKANAYGHACIQMPGLSAANGGDPGPLNEDCLYLNIWTPHSDPSARLPVMVWIHGGAYTFGAGGMLIYNGSPLATKGAVVSPLQLLRARAWLNVTLQTPHAACATGRCLPFWSAVVYAGLNC